MLFRSHLVAAGQTELLIVDWHQFLVQEMHPLIYTSLTNLRYYNCHYVTTYLYLCMGNHSNVKFVIQLYVYASVLQGLVGRMKIT